MRKYDGSSLAVKIPLWFAMLVSPIDAVRIVWYAIRHRDVVRRYFMECA